MFWEIDIYKKPIKPQIFLAKPDRTIIAKLSEAFNIEHQVMMLQLNYIEFHYPYEVEIDHNIARNDKVDLIRERYLLKVVKGSDVEWYRIIHLHHTMDDNGDYLQIGAYSIGFDLADKTIRTYKEESRNARQVLQDVLQNTNWSIAYLDADFELTYRDFEFNNMTILDAIYNIAETYNAVVVWDTVNRKVSFHKPELFGHNRGLKFSYSQYLKKLGRESNAIEMVTRLRVYGKDGLSIERVNPTGQNYIQDFSYFLFPFQRDENRNVISSSYYMSDSLCHAILDYEELIKSKEGEFQNLLKQKEKFETILTEKNNELYSLLNDKVRIEDIMVLQQAHDEMFFHKFNYMGSTTTRTTRLNEFQHSAVMCKVSSTNNLTVSLDGINRNVVANTWVLLGKVMSSSTTVTVSGSAKNVEIIIQIAKITEEEFNKVNNEQEIINKYNIFHKEDQIAQKEKEIEDVEKDIEQVDKEIRKLRSELSMENNFTSEQIEELNEFIIIRNFEDSRYIKDVDLYEAAKEKFEELRKPQMVIEIDVVNFLEIIEEQHNWDKLVLGDEVTIEYEKLDTKVTAKIIGMTFNYEEGNIKLVIANIKDIRDEAKKFEDFVYKGINTSISLNFNKSRWDKALVDAGTVSQLINNFWDRITNEINMASNQTVIIDHRGITIYDDQDRNKFLRATNGILGITNDGGLTYKHAITSEGIVGERIYGKIITGVNLTIGDEDGILNILGNKGTIVDRCDREVMRFGLIEEEPDLFGIHLNRFESDDCDNLKIINEVIMSDKEGFRITRNTGSGFENVAWLDTEGYFNGAGIRIHYISGTLTNGITIDSENGIVITRADGLVRIRFNTTEGINIEQFQAGNWHKKFYADINGQFYSEDLIAKRLRIVNDLNELMLDSSINYLNIGRFHYIITDGKLTPIEKLTLKTEWEKIQIEYHKLLSQAEEYKTSTRDSKILIDIPPFTNAFIELGNYVEPLLADMSVTTPVDRDEFEYYFNNYFEQARRIVNEITDALKYSSLQLGQPYNHVTIDAENGILIEKIGGVPVQTILNATEGITIQRMENGQWAKKFYVDTQGILHAVDLVAERLILRGSAGQLLLDANQNLIDFDNFDMILGTLTAEEILAQLITSDMGFIANITAARVQTSGKEAESGWTDYIKIFNNEAKWVTGRAVGSGTQLKAPNGMPLYWKDSERTGYTTENTGMPVMIHEYEEIDRLVMSFYGSGIGSFPYFQFGIGDGTGRNSGVTYPQFGDHGVGYFWKSTDGFYWRYLEQNTGYLREIKFDDYGLHIISDRREVNIINRDFVVISDGGVIQLNHSSGSSIEIASNGDITLNSVGRVVINGTRIDLNT